MPTALGFILLTANSILAIHRSWGDAAATIFVIASYASLVLLFYFLRLFETAPPGSPARDHAKIGVWLTTTLLTAMFSWRVVVLVPWPVVGAGVCFMGASIVAGGFYALFLLPSSSEDY
jgi:apolipoprotein N-acyltransferase